MFYNFFQEVESEVEDPEDKLPPYLPSVYGCRSVEEFQVFLSLYIFPQLMELS